MLLYIFIDFFSQPEERSHEDAVIHDLLSVCMVCVELVAMDVIGTGKSSPFISVCQHAENVFRGVELDLRWGVIECVDDHPLADEQVSSDGHGAG